VVARDDEGVEVAPSEKSFAEPDGVRVLEAQGHQTVDDPTVRFEPTIDPGERPLRGEDPEV
jgi:hypothetical protein